MRAFRVLLLAATATLLSGAAPGAALVPEGSTPPHPGSAALIEDAAAWDGRAVSFTGEAVGEALTRTGGAWLQLNDDAYRGQGAGESRPLAGYNRGQAVFAPAELAARVRTFGGWALAGDVVRVEGVFHAACREHGGDMDIHATALEIESPGHPVARPLRPLRVTLALVLLGLAGALFALRRRALLRRI